MRQHPRESGLNKVLAVIGGSKLADALGISRSAVSYWWRVPFRHAHKIEELTGVPLNEQRPDLWEVRDNIVDRIHD
jgi:hypothetical protein